MYIFHCKNITILHVPNISRFKENFKIQSPYFYVVMLLLKNLARYGPNLIDFITAYITTFHFNVEVIK